ncbi:MBL fold metallo-hydrolase [Priestia megaterium]|uniref:MBL fold metallo-hydrolase n=1 Tax=Priestia megaterium TaxID=1404 RepID=UPI002E227AAF|nr:MBL fold metallo-hydrolase [Priestia megaterium]
MGNSVKVFPAAHGDCFLLKVCGKTGIRYVLIDGGKGELCHKELKAEFVKLDKKNQCIDLLIVTHIDDDHIAGIIKLYKDKKINTSIINKVWFNSGNLISNKLDQIEMNNRDFYLNSDHSSKKMSVRQGITLEGVLNDTGVWYEDLIFSDQLHNLDGITLRILSPDTETLRELNTRWDSEMEKLIKKRANNKKMSSTTDYHKTINELSNEEFEEDSSLFNKSSIAFLLEYENCRLLMLGDAHPSIVVSSLKKLGYSEKNKLKLDLMKISHHASKKNTSPELLELLDCEKFIVSSDGSKHGLPNKQSLARIVSILNRPVTFYFNYSSMKKIFTSQECTEYKITCIYLNSSKDYTVEV